MLDVYADFAENWMAVPVIKGEKTAGERFPGADRTFCIEAMMHDRKALQAGTSHFLGPEFREARATFSSWAPTARSNWRGRRAGVSRRGSSARLLMTHSDDDGFVLPPKLAPQHVVIVPIYRVRRREDARARVLPQGSRRAARAALQRRAGARARRRARRARRREGVAVGTQGRAAAPRNRAARHREGRRVRGAARPRAEGQAERRAR